MAISWYLAPALAVLRSEINARWTDRDRSSDGSIGDVAHQATRSDHNPNVRGSVNALDVDADGVDMGVIIEAFQRHPSAHYWIWQRQIADRDEGWRRRPYSGPNPHDKHGHFSIRQTEAAEQDRRLWGLLVAVEGEEDMNEEQNNRLVSVAYRDDALLGMKSEAVYPVTRNGETETRREPNRLASTLLELRAGLVALAGRDWVDEHEIVEGVLAGLGGKPVDVVAETLRRAYADRPQELADLAARLAGPAS